METVTVKYDGDCPNFLTVWSGVKYSIPNGKTGKVPVSWWEHYKNHQRSDELTLIKPKKEKSDGSKNN